MNIRALACFAACCAALALSATTAPEPRLRFGVVTDTHVGPTDESCAKLKKAFELFKREKCALILNAGDIADKFNKEAYAAYLRAFDGVFTETPQPRALYAYAFHDACYYGGHARKDIMKHALEAFAEVKTALRAENGLLYRLDLGGCVFLVFPQHIGYDGFPTWEECDQALREACQEHPGQPVFVIDHIPSGGTWGGGPSKRTSMYQKYPQVVQFCGHRHASLRSDLLMWQGAYTVVHAGGLFNYGTGTIGYEVERGEAFGALTAEVYDDRIVFRRWDVRDGSEIAANDRWYVSIPYNPKTTTWSKTARRAKVAVPEFAADAKLSTASVEQKGKWAGVKVTIPATKPAAYLYKVEMQRRNAVGDWATYTWREVEGEAWLANCERDGSVSTTIDKAFLDSGAETRFVVTPRNAYGVYGKLKLVSESVKLPAFPSEGRRIYECRKPIEELSFGLGNGGKPIQPKDGWVGPVKKSELVIKLPDGLFVGSKKQRYRITVELESEQTDENTSWLIRVKNGKGSGYGSHDRLKMPFGQSGSMRYVLDCSTAGKQVEGAKTDTFWLYLSEFSSGRIRPTAIWVEAL